MSIVKGSFTTRIEDYSAINTGLALDVNEHRWYNNVDGYSSDQVILLIGNGVTTIANLLKYGNPTNTSEVITSSPATITAGADHTVFVDTNTIGGSASLLVNDPTVINYRLTVVAVGAYLVNVTLTGFSVEQVPSGEARSYVWNGISWVLASGGGGGGDLAGIQVPRPKTFVDKGVTPAQSITNQWEEGIYLIGVEAASGLRSTQILNVSDLAKDWLASPYTDAGAGTGTFKVEYRSATNDFYATQVAYTSVVISSISKFEADPDNLPLVTIPADPATIPGWVEEYNNPTPQITPVEYVDNDWGSGLFYFGVSYIFLTEEVRTNGIMAVEVDGIDRTATLNVNGSSSVIVKYYGATNEFRAFAIGTDFTSVSMVAIYKWDSVSTGDLPVPVDGWETVFLDLTNGDPVNNAWGDGTYEIMTQRTGDAEYFTFHINVYASLDGTAESTETAGTDNAKVTCATGVFYATSDGTTHFIKRIRKFNSLVNVQHTFVPDPRSVAQKDWVTKYEDSSGILTSIPLAWGAGFYRVETKDAASATRASFFINITQEAIDDGVDLLRGTYAGSSGTAIILTYNSPTNALRTTESAATHQFRKIEKYEDSQASDAPRTVLDDGWETVFEDAENTTQTIIEAVGNGLYELLITDAATRNQTYSANIIVNNGKTICWGAISAADNAFYTTATGVWDCNNAAFDIVRLRKFTGLLRIDSQVVTNTSEGSNITNAVIDTDAGDVDASSYFTDITQDRVVKLTNDGTNGNHLTGCPNGIEIGDGKTVEFYYNLGWRYQDVPIDKFTYILVPTTDMTNILSGTVIVKKWAGGDMTQLFIVDPGVLTASKIINNYPVPWAGAYYAKGSMVLKNSASGGDIINRIDVSPDAYQGINDAGNPIASLFNLAFEGRWKTGV